MKMKTGKECRRLSCEVWTAREFTFQTEVLCGLGADAVGYAVCRFLTKCDVLCRDYVEQSYRLRLKQGKGRRSVRSWFTAPARMMELPGELVRVEVLISPAGVEVLRVGISASEGPVKKRINKSDRPVIRVWRSAS